jgi:hypothetical protein
MPSVARRNFIEVDYCQSAKNGQFASGDIFLSRKFKEENRSIAVLSDGLGSGVKANVLATLTATMALKYTSSFIDIKRTAEIMMDTLPICSVRKINYSTFTIVDMDTAGNARIIEHENPPFIIVRDGKSIPIEKSSIHLRSGRSARSTLRSSRRGLATVSSSFPTGSRRRGWASIGRPSGGEPGTWRSSCRKPFPATTGFPPARWRRRSRPGRRKSTASAPAMTLRAG